MTLFEKPKCLPENFFSTVRQISSDRKSCYSLHLNTLIHRNVQHQKMSETPNGSPKIFSAQWDKTNFYNISWYPLLCIKSSDNRNFPKQRRVSPKKFFRKARKKIRRKMVIFFPPPPTPLHSLSVSIPEVLQNTGGFYNEVSRYSEISNFRQKLGLFPSTTTLSSI